MCSWPATPCSVRRTHGRLWLAFGRPCGCRIRPSLVSRGCPMRLLPRFCLTILLAMLPPAVGAEPSAGNDTTPSCISLVGTNGIAAAPLGQFTVIGRDLANNPSVGAVITIDLSACPDLFICADQLDDTPP